MKRVAISFTEVINLTWQSDVANWDKRNLNFFYAKENFFRKNHQQFEENHFLVDEVYERSHACFGYQKSGFKRKNHLFIHKAGKTHHKNKKVRYQVEWAQILRRFLKTIKMLAQLHVSETSKSVPFFRSVVKIQLNVDFDITICYKIDISTAKNDENKIFVL